MENTDRHYVVSEAVCVRSCTIILQEEQDSELTDFNTTSSGFSSRRNKATQALSE